MNRKLLTISQLAKYVGVTVRAVRHYHALGLLPEPKRDGSGYRRYGADAVIALMRIKVLAAAGVPLAQVASLTQAPAETFTAAVASIKTDIAKRIDELAATKQRLDALNGGDRMFVSEAVADYLDYARHIGLSEALVARERDAWILLSALHPNYVDTWARQKKTLLESPALASLYLRLDKARDWPADDPRLIELAQDMLREADEPPPIAGQAELTADKQGLALIDDHGENAFASWKRLSLVLRDLQAQKLAERQVK